MRMLRHSLLGKQLSHRAAADIPDPDNSRDVMDQTLSAARRVTTNSVCCTTNAALIDTFLLLCERGSRIRDPTSTPLGEGKIARLRLAPSFTTHVVPRYSSSPSSRGLD